MRGVWGFPGHSVACRENVRRWDETRQIASVDQGPSRWVALALGRRAAFSNRIRSGCFAVVRTGASAFIRWPGARGGRLNGGAAVELDFFDVSLASLGWSATGLFANGTLDLSDTRSGKRVTYRKR